MRTVAILVAVIGLVGCPTTNFKPYETRTNVFEGKGGTKVVVEGVEVWENGSPPRKFAVLGIVEDQRSGGRLWMAQRHADIVQKAKEVGGDAVIALTDNSQIVGVHSSGSATAFASGYSANASGTSIAIPISRNTSKFAVIKYLE